MEKIIYQNNILDIVVMLLYLLGVLHLSGKFKSFPKNIYLMGIYIGIAHALFSFTYYFYSFSTVADAKGYYLVAYEGASGFMQASLANGTTSIIFFLYPLIHFFSLSYLSCFLVFSFISLIGVYRLYEVLLVINEFKWSKWFYLMLLPSMHFWTGSIGKDALIFFGICSILHVYFLKRSKLYYILPLLLIGIVRFYILAFIVGGVFIALILLSKQIKLSYKVFLMAFFTIGVIVVLPYLFESVNLKGFGDIEQQKAIIQQANMEGGGAIDLSDSNMLVKWISYVFRPFIFEAKNMFGLVTALENILWIIMFFTIFKGILNSKVRGILGSPFWINFVCIFAITLPAAFILSNLGIAARQKIMVLPFLLIIFFITLKAKKFKTFAKKKIAN